MNDVPQPQFDVPQLRTLLLTDLCDSTELVEKLGDAASAELFREHDTLVLQLQQQWRGRLIDRSDGLLLLFERPIDGLGFALDYQQGLRDLGKARGLRLLARAGLHVGEVLTWRNSEEAVQIGAKPLEVEGLAKPVAARLMSLARPGQILLSAVAESLTHRAARELGERGERLLWKSHGRWRFKGMPTAMEIYEVGEIGLTPLRMPRSSAKAWRDIPLWRRPSALVAEAVLLAMIAVGGWLFTRPEPALAFAERDWVVVGDMRNLTGDTLLDDSLQQAFRISLEQSRYVNVLSDVKVRQTLSLMKRDPDSTVLDRTVATEVALRDAARLVIMPSVAEVGGKLQINVEVVDPHSQSTLYATSAAGNGMGSLLGSIDAVTSDLRGSLGEALHEVHADSAPLPQVATSNMDALRAYGLALEYYVRRDFEQARAYFQQAASLDPDFSLAYLGVMRTYLSSGDSVTARQWLDKARESRSHLAPREALYLDAWSTEFDSNSTAKARQKWDMLFRMYPDYYAGSAQSAWLDFLGGDFASAAAKTRLYDVPQCPQRDVAVELRARTDLAREDYALAISNFRTAEQMGGYGPTRRRVAALAAAGRFDEAESIMDSLTLASGITNGFEMLSLPVDRQLGEVAVASAKHVLDVADGQAPVPRYALQVSANNVLALNGDAASSGNYSLIAKAALKDAGRGDVEDLTMIAMAAVRSQQRFGNGVDDEVVESLVDQASITGAPVLERMATVLRAEQLRTRNQPEKAMKLLREMMARPGPDLFQAHVALRDTLLDLGRHTEAAAEQSWIAKRRGLAYIEPYGGQVLQVMNVADARAAASATGLAAVYPRPPAGLTAIR